MTEWEDSSQAILNSLSAQIAVLDKNGTIINVNEAWKRSAEENDASPPIRAGVGLNYLEVCRTAVGSGAGYARQCLAGFRALLNGSVASFDVEYPFHTPAAMRWFLMRAVPLNMEDGGLVVSHIDITGRKQAEAELQKYRDHLEELVAERAADLVDVNQRLQRELAERKRAESQRDATLESLRQSQIRTEAILDNMLQGFVLFDRQGRILAANALARRNAEFVYGLPLQEGGSIYDFVHEHDRQAFDRDFSAALRGVPVRLEFPVSIPNADVYWYDFGYAPVFDDDGQVWAIAFTAFDITERVRAENRLRESEARLQSILDNTPAIIYIKDLQGQYLLINRRCEEVLNLKNDEVKGKTTHEILPKELADQFVANDRKVIEAGAPLEFEEIIPQDDGLHTVLSVQFPLRNASGDPYAICGISTDITERKRMQEALQEAHDELEKRIEERTADLRQEIVERERAEDKLRQRLEVEQALATISARFMQANDFDQAVSDTLEDVGRLVGVSRVHLFRLRDYGNQIRKTHEWCAPGVAPVIRNWQDVPTTNFPWLIEKLRADEIVLIEDVSQLPPEARSIKERLEQQQIKSLVVFPLFADKELAGFFGCDGLSRSGADLEEDLRLLKVVAGMLGGAFQREVVLETLEQRVADRTRELAVFFDMTMLASQSQDMQDILEPTVGKILESSGGQAICIHLLAEDHRSLRLVAQRGMSDVSLRQVQTVLPQGEFADWITRPNDPILALDVNAARHVPVELRVKGFRSYLGAQLRVRGQPQGILSCFWESGQHFSLDEVSLLVAIAEQLGVTVENNRLRQQIEEMAVVEERQRLARELHDAVTQSVYSLTLFARSGRQALEDGDTDRLENSLSQLEDSALLALKEMRLLLYQLLPVALEREGLTQALKLRFDSVERRLGIEVDYQVDGSVDLPKSVEGEIYRIAIEALNNALKHARASLISVHIGSDGNQVKLKITDNGQGFDPAEVYSGMGLKNMRERAERLGGWLNISSTHREGTQVLMSVGSGE